MITKERANFLIANYDILGKMDITSNDIDFIKFYIINIKRYNSDDPVKGFSSVDEINEIIVGEYVKIRRAIG